jgi:acyl-[acyl-carrier-protein] desaturase
MEPVVERLMQHHISTYPRTVIKPSILEYLPSKIRENISNEPRHWNPSEILPHVDMKNPEDRKFLEDLQDRAKGYPKEVVISLALNIITEEGLPHYHRLLDTCFTKNSPYVIWNNRWTAEENTHGAGLERFALYSGVMDNLSLEKKIFEHLNKGFNPKWIGNPWKLFMYTSLQEMATKISHEKTGRLVEKIDPLFNEITRIVALDEARHYAFYLSLFKEVLARDPNDALVAAEPLMKSIDMPAVELSDFKDMAEVIASVNIYNMREFKGIVERIIQQLKLKDEISGLLDDGKRAQESILSIPSRLDKFIERYEHSRKQKSFTFDLLYNKEMNLKQFSE